MTSLRFFVLFEFFVMSLCFLPAVAGQLPVVSCVACAAGCYLFVGLLLWITAMLNECATSFIRTLALWAPALWFEKPEWMEAR